MYSAWEISKYIVQKSIDINRPIHNLKLQKLLFYCQLEYIKRNNGLLFEDEIIFNEYGAFIPSVYYKLNCNGICDLYLSDLIRKSELEIVIEIDTETTRIIDEVINKYKDTLTWDLVSMNQKEDIWKDLYCDNKIKNISSEDLLKYYCK
ncbi:Panacea domain-containing protein [Clostridium sp. M14]|uniref:Panacea domain-containing protein n=1 Tax=Clostridium sp. M14 TaxID=2716311 RepID=UPI0013EE5F45|nr:Panacea domain-containing protein [Clostridium sp. M14]MBZ9693262.1 SocA family protein [Clostridium sp. M14]